MGKSRTSYAISILHTRPHIPATFLKVYHIKSSETPETLQKVFTEAFKETHPDWPIKQVIVETE